MKANRHSPTRSRIFSAVLALALTVFSGCTSSTAEQQVRAVLDAAAIAIEARDTSDTLALLADDYKDSQGYDKLQVRQYLRAYFVSHPKIELIVNVGAIEFETKNLAQVRIDAVIVGTQGADASINADAPAFKVELRRDSSAWRITRVDRITQ
jgi:hypothetical protein